MTLAAWKRALVAHFLRCFIGQFTGVDQLINARSNPIGRIWRKAMIQLLGPPLSDRLVHLSRMGRADRSRGVLLAEQGRELNRPRYKKASVGEVAPVQ